MKPRFLALAAAAVLAFPVVVSAQSAPPPPAAQPPMAGHHHGLKAMLTPLNLTAAQQSQIQSITTNYRGQMKAATDPQSRKAIRDKEMADINGVLTPAQQSQLSSEIATARAAHHHKGGAQNAPAAAPTAIPTSGTN